MSNGPIEFIDELKAFSKRSNRFLRIKSIFRLLFCRRIKPGKYNESVSSDFSGAVITAGNGKRFKLKQVSPSVMEYVEVEADD